MPSLNFPSSPPTDHALSNMEGGDPSNAPGKNHWHTGTSRSGGNKSEGQNGSLQIQSGSNWRDVVIEHFVASVHRVTFAFSEDDDTRARNQQDAASLDEGDTATNVEEVEGQGWKSVYEELKKYDEDWIKRRSDHISDLQIFAGLFSAVLTPFLVEIYVELQPDNTQLSAPILVDLSRQLHSISLNQVAPATSISLTPSDPSNRITTVASFWFLSLILSLGSALFGLLVKQWYHEYIRWITIFPVQHAVRVRQCRYDGLKSWSSHTMLSVMTVFLEVALVLFFVGLALLLWEVNELAAKVITTAICIILSIAISCTVLPTIIPSLPYRTFLGSSFLHTARFIRKLSAKFLIVLIRIFGSPDSEVASIKYVGRNPFKRAQEGLRRLLTSPTLVLKASSAYYWKEYDSWAKSDMLHRLNHTPEKTAVDQANILVWLFTHAGCHLTNNLIKQCISDAADVPPAHLSWEEEKNSRWVTSGLERTRQNFAMPYLSFCTFLYGMMKTNKSLPKGFDKYENFEDILDELFPKSLFSHQNQDDSSGTASRSRIAFNEKSISRLSKSIQELDRKLEHKLLDYFISFIETFLKWQSSDSSLSWPRSQDILDIVAEILRILVLFRFRTDSSSELESTFSPHWLSQNHFGERISKCLESAFERIVGEDLGKLKHPGRNETDIKLTELQIRAEDNCDRAVTSLAIGVSHSFLDDMYPGEKLPNDIVIKNMMLSATRFMCFYAPWSFSSPEQSHSNNSANEKSNKKGRKIFPSARTRVFWNIADHVFRYYAQVPAQNLIPDVDRCRHKFFLTAIEKAIQIEKDAQSHWGKNSTRIRPSYLCDMPAYLLRYRSLLPLLSSAAGNESTGLLDTLRHADNDGVINIQDMLDETNSRPDPKSPDPESTDPNSSPPPARVRRKLGLWRLLENPDSTIRDDD